MNNHKQEHFPVKNRLHTDILEQKYGVIHAVVLRHDNVERKKQGLGVLERHY